MLALKNFLKSFDAEEVISLDSAVQIKEYYFTVTEKQREFLLKHRPVFIGNCLGKQKGNLFCPSIYLLDNIAAMYSKKIIVNAKTEWLFICGRDIFSIQEVLGNPQEKDTVLVLNRFKECIGIAQFNANPNKKNPIKHVYDIGDYLRRERKRKL